MANNTAQLNQVVAYTPQEERRDILDLFQEGLAGVFRLDDDLLMEELNDSIIGFLIKDEKFRKDLENALYRNNERLTYKEFNLNGNPGVGNITNWLKDFIRYHGTGMFDNVVLSRYLISSDNAKKLDDQERKFLQKLLRVYRNIKFFPDSMKETPPEQWHIMPIDKGIIAKSRVVVGPPKTEEEKKIEELKKEENKYTPSGIERLALQEEIDKNKKIEDLKIEMKKYPENSFERKAIEEEIRRL